MKVAIGCDEAAYELKENLNPSITAEGHEVADFGTVDGKPVLYPDIAHALATAWQRVGMTAACCSAARASAWPLRQQGEGHRAAQCHDTYSAERARKSNDAQILTSGRG